MKSFTLTYVNSNACMQIQGLTYEVHNDDNNIIQQTNSAILTSNTQHVTHFVLTPTPTPTLLSLTIVATATAATSLCSSP